MAPDQHHSAVSRVSFFQYSRRDENRPRRNASSQRLERASVPRWSYRTPTPPLELEWSADFASSVLSRKQHPCGKVSEGILDSHWTRGHVGLGFLRLKVGWSGEQNMTFLNVFLQVSGLRAPGQQIMITPQHDSDRCQGKSPGSDQIAPD